MFDVLRFLNGAGDLNAATEGPGTTSSDSLRITAGWSATFETGASERRHEYE